jgi:hypothetical protein
MRDGSIGWPVYGLQTGLNHAINGLSEDGVFGQATERAVKAFQKAHDLTADGIAGPATQARLCHGIVAKTTVTGVPSGLGRSIMEGESGYWLGAVNWSVPGGVDCGVVQRRVYGPPFSPQVLRDAFDPSLSLLWALHSLKNRSEEFYTQVGVRNRKDRKEYALRLAVLAHNWPWAADWLADGHELSTTKQATWVPNGTRFSDGVAVRSYRDWAEFYALGGPHGEARMTRYVEHWPR